MKLAHSCWIFWLGILLALGGRASAAPQNVEEEKERAAKKRRK